VVGSISGMRRKRSVGATSVGHSRSRTSVRSESGAGRSAGQSRAVAIQLLREHDATGHGGSVAHSLRCFRAEEKKAPSVQTRASVQWGCAEHHFLGLRSPSAALHAVETALDVHSARSRMLWFVTRRQPLRAPLAQRLQHLCNSFDSGKYDLLC
jgi:hypothetical protein